MLVRETKFVVVAAFMGLIVLTPVASATPNGTVGGIPNAAGVYAGCSDVRTGPFA